jgi:hypothetical protein
VAPPRLMRTRAGTIGLLLTAYDIWRRLPPGQRQMIIAASRKHGPRLARAAVERGKARRTKPKP